MNSDISRHPQDKDDFEDDHVHFGQLALVFIGFAILYFATGFFFDSSLKTMRAKDFPTSRMFGPIDTTKPNTVVEISMRNRFLRQSWSFVEVEILKQDKNRLLSFGGEFSHEQGRDADGPWSESQTDRNVRVTLPDPGKYYLKFNAEGGRMGALGASATTDRTRLDIRVVYKRGNSTIFNLLGIIVLIIGVVLNELRNRTLIKILGKVLSDDD